MNYLLGLIGHPIAQSLSPSLQKAALSHFGLAGDYQLFDVEPSELGAKLIELKKQGLHGFNITIPHKVSVYSLCDELTAEAKACGATNTVLISDDGRLTGHNTDFLGLRDALHEVVLPELCHGATACVFGAGGAARAAIKVLEKMEFASIMVIVRDVAKATESLKIAQEEQTSSKILIVAIDDVSTTDDTSAEVSKVLLNTTLMVNCLPIGQTIKTVPEWLVGMLRLNYARSPYVYDMVYSKTSLPTPLVEVALAAGLRSRDGMTMLLHQAIYAFQFWTGKIPPYDVLEKAFKQALAS